MTDTYTLSIRVDSYEFGGEFYLVGEGYGTGGDVLKHVATDHILAMKQRPHVAEYLLEILQGGENVPKSEYEQVDPDVSCGLHFDVDHQQFRVWVAVDSTSTLTISSFGFGLGTTPSRSGDSQPRVKHPDRAASVSTDVDSRRSSTNAQYG